MLRRSAANAICLVWLCDLLFGCSSEADPAPSPNSMLERWCDNHPCGWDLDGDFKQVGTWHPNDYAVELLGEEARLSQLRAELTSSLTSCFEFSLMARVDDHVRAYLELDFLDDGSIEFSARIPASDWQVRRFTIMTPTWYQGVRFIVRKEGAGQVIVGEFNVTLTHQRCSGTPLPLRDRPAGARCEGDDECSSGTCVDAEESTGGTCD